MDEKWVDLSRIEHGLSLLLSPYPSKVSLQLTIVVKKTYNITIQYIFMKIDTYRNLYLILKRIL